MRTGKGSIFIITALALLSLLTWSTGVGQAATTITLTKALHVPTEDGRDILIHPGTYEVEGTETNLLLSTKGEGTSISIPAEQTPFPEEVDSPVAMAIPLSEEGVYISLVLPGARGLETMAYYSGIQTRGVSSRFRSGLRVRQQMSSQRRTQLTSFARQFRKTPQAPKIRKQWKQLIQRKQTRDQGSNSTNGIAAMIQVLRQVNLQTTEILRSLADQVKANIQKKRQLREQMKKLNEITLQAPSNRDTQEAEKLKAKLDQALEDLLDQELEDLKKIQAAASQHRQVQRAAAKILKKQDEAKSSAIQKITN